MKSNNKTHTTNYSDTFIEIAEDSKQNIAEPPPLSEKSKTIARLQYEMLLNNPYKYTSDDVLFSVFAIKNGIADAELVKSREEYFSKGQPCFRASPLTKRYGWGIHSDNNGKIAMYGVESEEYREFLDDNSTTKVKAMRSSRK